MKSMDERKAELAEKLREAAAQVGEIPDGDVRGFYGGPDMWGMIAGHLMDAVEEIMRDILAEQNDDDFKEVD